MAAFEFDDTLEWTFVRDGMVFEYLNGTVADTPGQYNVVVMRADGTKVSAFSFSIANPFSAPDGGAPPDSALPGIWPPY
jgi:hypothetical protein